MSTHGKSAINTSDRTRTDVKSDIKVTLIEKTQTLEDYNTSIQDNQVVKKNIKRRKSSG